MGVVVRGKRRHVRPDSIHVLRGNDTRRRILVAARVRVLAEGFEALHLDDLARDVGVTKAAIVKSVGGKASILLALGEQDRESRLEILRHALTLRTGLKRRVSDAVGRLYILDLPRLKLVQAYVGYLWFWTGADHDRAQGHVDGTLDLLTDLMRSAVGPDEAQDRIETLALRLMAGYVIGLRDLFYARSDIAEATRLVVDFVTA
jgi:AcrR family transcriptional regulator